MRRLPKIIRSVPGKKCYCSKLLCAASREEEKEKKNETHCLLSATRMAEVIVHYSTRQAQEVVASSKTGGAPRLSRHTDSHETGSSHSN